MVAELYEISYKALEAYIGLVEVTAECLRATNISPYDSYVQF